MAGVLATRGGAAAPDATARLLPAGTLLYAHVSTGDERLRALAGRFASLRLALARAGMAFTPSAGALDFARDIRPWLGDEVAFALLDGGAGRPQPMLLAAVRDRGRAEALLARLGATPAGSHAGVALRRLPPSATAAFAGAHLAVGPEQAVRGAIDRAAGKGSTSLADGRVYRRAAEDRDSASVSLFATSAGLRRLLAGRDGIAGLAGRLAASPRLEGVTARARAEDGGLRVTARVLRAPGPARSAAFTPSLTGRVPEGAAAFVALPGLDAVAGLASLAGGAAVLEGLREALPQAAGIELDDVLAPLSGEATITVAAGEDAPVVTVVARTRDEAGTREAMARLQGPISERLAGGTPFEQRGETFSLPVTPRLEPSYALSRGVLVASTARSGLEQLRPARAPLTRAEVMRRVAPEEGAKVEALGFLDPRRLLELGERTGLRASSSPAVRDDLRRIRAAGAVVEEDATHPTDTIAELFLEIP